jgi:hypothetical protein
MLTHPYDDQRCMDTTKNAAIKLQHSGWQQWLCITFDTVCASHRHAKRGA